MAESSSTESCVDVTSKDEIKHHGETNDDKTLGNNEIKLEIPKGIPRGYVTPCVDGPVICSLNCLKIKRAEDGVGLCSYLEKEDWFGKVDIVLAEHPENEKWYKLRTDCMIIGAMTDENAIRVSPLCESSASALCTSCNRELMGEEKPVQEAPNAVVPLEEKPVQEAPNAIVPLEEKAVSKTRSQVDQVGGDEFKRMFPRHLLEESFEKTDGTTVKSECNSGASGVVTQKLNCANEVTPLATAPRVLKLKNVLPSGSVVTLDDHYATITYHAFSSMITTDPSTVVCGWNVMYNKAEAKNMTSIVETVDSGGKQPPRFDDAKAGETAAAATAETTTTTSSTSTEPVEKIPELDCGNPFMKNKHVNFFIAMDDTTSMIVEDGDILAVSTDYIVVGVLPIVHIRCACCGKGLNGKKKAFKCKACKFVCYCSEVCALVGWCSGHWSVCKYNAQLLSQ